MRKLNNPPHPGSTLREDILPALGLTVTAAATELGVTRVRYQESSMKKPQSHLKWQSELKSG